LEEALFKKYKKLKGTLKRLKSVVIAFSGGVDSSLLAKVAYDVLGNNSMAVTASSPTYPWEELAEAKITAKRIGIKHIIVNTQELKNEKFIKNTPYRCYWCKRELLSRLKRIASNLNYSSIIDGTNYDDKEDFRPGRQANLQFKVISPLLDCRFTKEDIQSLAKHLNLPFWSKPKGTCLASRIPFGEKITVKRLKRIERGEEILKNFLGKDKLIRLRDHKEIARLEFPFRQIDLIFKKRGWNTIIEKIKNLGYKYVVVDLEGYIPQGKR
jgi:uncharacterized protein